MPEILVGLLPIVLMFGLMYVLLIVPERRRNKKYTAMLSELKVNDEIVTRGGLVGKIISIDEDYLVLQSGPDRTKIKMVKNSISQKLSKEVE